MSIKIQKDIHEICEFLQVDGASRDLIIASTTLNISYTHLMSSLVKTQHDGQLDTNEHEKLQVVLDEIKLVRDCLDTCNIKLKDIETKVIGTKENNYPIKEDLRI